ncbi:MAG: bifunctional folylpolyglutamate synthase/dihydrofolate synthase [Actinomycetia bacterium]|nr:bifunctional folylpolyglutamate synthase/dihydrofolate synthase [Actinomycetes bacterium]MCP4958496.1 bifunctional folylpolyglutamate synthase/dihydrofolate synthase [Actinomycetes bacterium]
MDYAAALEHIEQHYSLELYPATRATAPDLSRMVDLVEAMGDPHLGLPTIHVTGTNGKGSTMRIITALLMAHGLHVGGYTSPHLERVNERIISDGEPLDDDDFAQAIADVAAAEVVCGDRWDREATFFEILAAAALGWMAMAPVDVRVLEVGMGGLWDATNVVEAEVAVITTIAEDHLATLGPELADVAREKAGIIKAGSRLVIGELDDELADIVFEQPSEGDPVRLGHNLLITKNQQAVGGRSVSITTSYATYDDLFLGLHGEHQASNSAVALAAVEAFFDREIPRDIVDEAFGTVVVPGRFEVVRRRPLIALDGAHNPAAATAASRTLYDDFVTDHKPVLVVGFNAPRDLGEMFDALRATSAAAVVATAADWPRAFSADRVAEEATLAGVENVVWIPSVADAVDRAIEMAGEDGVILVTGSLYVVGEARGHLL